MKPIKLTVQAFGPFSGTEKIDFNELGPNPLFLINGPTGAGKSSILDAVCFALYGQTTGAERSATQMRCDFADMDLLTEVTLDFSLTDKSYRIKRIPMQERAKSRGEGTTTQQSEATLWELNGTAIERLIVSSSVKEADREIKELIGLDVEQFRQVMVLPQGKFRDLLLADSKDREKIFSQLFQTSIYKKIEDALKLQASEIKKAVDQHQNQIKGILHSADVNTEEEVSRGIESIKPSLETAKDNKTVAAETVNQSEKKLEAAKQLLKKFQEFEQKTNELETHKLATKTIDEKKQQLTLASSAQKLEPLFNKKNDYSERLIQIKNKFEQSQSERSSADGQLKAATEAFDKAQKAHQAVDAIQKQLTTSKQYLQLATDLEKATETESSALKRAEASKQKFSTEEGIIQQITTTIAQQEQRIEQLTTKIAPLAEQKILSEKLKQSLKDRQNLEKLQDELVVLKQQTIAAKEVLATAAEALSEQQQSAKKVELAWHANQAAILASELSEGQPCPVCGSLEHPDIAHSPEGAEIINKEDVDAAREQVVIQNREHDLAKSKRDEALGNEKVKQSLVNELTKTLGDVAMQSVEDAESAYQHQLEKLEKLLAHQETLSKSKQQLSLDKDRLTEANESFKQLDKQAATDNEQLIIARTNKQQLEEQLPEQHRDAGELGLKIAALTQNIQSLNNALVSARDTKDSARSSFDKADANNKALAAQLAEVEKENGKAIADWEQAISNSLFDDENHFNRSLLNDDQQRQLDSEIKTFKTRLDTLTGAKAQLEAELKGKNQPELEALEDTLEQARLVFAEKDDIWRQLEERKNLLVAVQDKLGAAHKKNQQLEDQYRIVGTLYEVSNGLTGDKVSLQRFVLSVLLDDVLIQASQRLTMMSKGRYQLIRKEERAKGNKASGLELEVDDAYTGKSRPVSTLSGGESFMAALALALGLSDVVQSYSGGIKLDTLFIDEGFGSLDPESLDLAIRTLIDLQSSGRMIGIISHVTELKSQMGLRIDVTSGKSGSGITTVAA